MPLDERAERLKAWRERREGFASHAQYLAYLAAGDDAREDVQAARRLLQKPRYAAAPQEATGECAQCGDALDELADMQRQMCHHCLCRQDHLAEDESWVTYS